MVVASSPPTAQRICTLVWVSGWVGVRVCVWGGGGSRYLGCVSGGVATVISLGIRSSLGFRFRIMFRVGIRCCTPDTRPVCCGPARARLRSLGRPRTGVQIRGGRRGVMCLFWLVRPLGVRIFELRCLGVRNFGWLVRSLGVRIFGLRCLGVRNFGSTVFWLAGYLDWVHHTWISVVV